MNRTLAQERSELALEQIRDLKTDRDKFAKLVSGLPAMILQNGFGQTLAFLLAKGTNDNEQNNQHDKHTEAFKVIVCWLKQRNILSDPDAAMAMKALSTMDQTKYLFAQQEAMAILEWVKRYANAGLFS